ncbi:MAG: protoporphyrinogen oxidase [Homoserinimonas sp.]|nr:protoporphyrinogen oxidase [Homoserinimonas sp.]
MPDPERPGPDVVIVGGGVAGLVAARDLAIGGLKVTVLERSETFGGKVRRHTVDGIDLDAGAESFATRHDTVADLLRELDLGDDIVFPDASGAWLKPARGPSRPLPKTGVLGIPGTPMAQDVIDVVGLSGAFRAQLDALLPGFIGSREKTLGGLVRKRMGRAVLNKLVAPIATGIHSRHPDELDVDTVAPGLRSGLNREESLAQAVLALRAASPAGSAVAGLEGGIYRVTDALHARLIALGVTLVTHATVVEADATGVTLADGERIAASRVVLAAPLPVQSTSRIVLATLVVHAAELDVAPRGTGLLVAEDTPGIRAKALTHATIKWRWLAEMAGKHRHVIRLSYDGDVVETDFERQARTDAEMLLGVDLPPETITGFARVDWYAPSLRKVSSDDGLWRIGESISGTGLAAVVAHARSTASELLSSFTGKTDTPEDD